MFFSLLLNSYLTCKVLFPVGAVQDIDSGLGGLEGDLIAVGGGSLVTVGGKEEEGHDLGGCHLNAAVTDGDLYLCLGGKAPYPIDVVTEILA